MKKELLLHYVALSEFTKQFKSKVLDVEHLDEKGEIHLRKLTLPDGHEDDRANFWGWQLHKDGDTYLISNSDKEGNKVSIKDILPIVPAIVEKVANNGKVYKYVRKYNTVKFQSIKKYSFRDLVDFLSDIPHTNIIHRKLATILGISSLLDRANFRLSTPPGFGKDSIVDTLGNLMGGCATIENPTLAKLEREASLQDWLAVNEVVDIAKGDWRLIEQFLLAAGAFKPTITKRSRAFGGVGETIYISKFSISLMYNDVDCYPNADKYFDMVTKKAVIDRFVPFRLYGTFRTNFTEIDTIDVEQFVKENTSIYKDLLYTLTYYSNNAQQELSNYNSDKLMQLKPRWKTNILKLLKYIDLYCENQEEFDEWIGIINSCIKDYEAMINYPAFHNVLLEKYGEKKMKEIDAMLKTKKTFTERIRMMDSLLREEAVTREDKLNKYW